MDILYCLACDIAFTGTPVFVRDVISAFPQNNSAVYTPFAEKDRVFSDTTTVYCGNLKPSKNVYMKIARNLEEKLENRKFDIIHINTANIHLAYVYTKFFKKTGAKIICHSHNVINYNNVAYARVIAYMKKYIVENSDVLLACSKEAGVSMFREKTSFHILKDYIDSKRFAYNSVWRKEIRQEYPCQILLGHIGAFNGQKNQMFLLKLMCMLDTRFSLLLIGDGDQKNQCIDYCKEHGIDDRVFFHSSCENIEKYYSAFDILLLPSFYEGMSLVLLEAQASHLNQIVSEFVPYNSVFACSYLPLNEEEWVGEILHMAENLNERYDNTEIILRQGYDKTTAILPLKELYSQLVN